MHEFESVSDLQANAMSLTMDILIYIYGTINIISQIPIDFRW